MTDSFVRQLLLYGPIPEQLAGWIMETYAEEHANELAMNDSMRGHAVALLSYRLKGRAIEHLIETGGREVLDAVLATRESRYDPLSAMFWEWNLDADIQHNIAMRKYPAVLGEYLLQDSIGMSVEGLTEETIRVAAERCGRTLSKTWWKRNYRPAGVPEVTSRKRPVKIIRTHLRPDDPEVQRHYVLDRTIADYANPRYGRTYGPHIELAKILRREFGTGSTQRSRDMWAAFFALTEHRGEAKARDLITTVRTLGRIDAKQRA